MKKRMIALMLAGIMVLSVTACGGGGASSKNQNNQDDGESKQVGVEVTEDMQSAPPEDAPVGGQVVVAISPGTLSPDMYGGWSNNATNSGFIGLMSGYALADYNRDYVLDWDPVVVKDHEVIENDDGSKTYRFEINDNLKWSDGSPITAKDYVFSLLLHSSPEFAACEGDATYGWALVGYNDHVQGTTKEFAGVGQDHVLAINDKGTLYTWGFNRMGLNVIPPELKGKKIADIEAGYQVSVVVTEDGKVVSWGNTSAVDISTANVKDEKVKEVKANIQTAIALTKDGKVISLAKKETALDNVPEEIQGKVEKIALTDKAAAAVLKDGTVKVWGNNHNHIFSVPEEVQGKAVDISGGRNHLVVVTEDGNAVAWGGNENNQAKVPAKATNIAKLASGYYQNCIIKEDGSVVTWGLKGYLLGTDNLGRNVFYRILKGGQMTMTVGFIAVIIQFAIGILVGGISGYYGGTVDILLMRLAEVVGSLPFIPLALILSALIGNKVSDVGRIIMIMLILGFLGWTGIAGLVRAQVLAERNKEFVVAAKALGVKEKNIIFRHIVPNVMTIIIVQATISFATCMLTESGLSFLGFGVAEPIPSWGNMLNNCRSSEVISQYWWRWVFPSVVLGLCTVSINLFGDGLRRAVDPKANER